MEPKGRQTWDDVRAFPQLGRAGHGLRQVCVKPVAPGLLQPPETPGGGPRWPRSPRRAAALLLLLGAGEALVLLACARVGLAEGLPWLVPLLLAAGLAWILAGRVALSAAVGGRPAFLAGIVVGALLLRGVVGLGDPRLSEDVERSVWEAGLVLEGISPYAAPPDSPSLSAERARWPGVYGRMNHRDVSAAYPPLTQAACALVVALAGGPARADGRVAAAALRLFFTLCDLVVLLPLLSLAAPERRAAAALTWGWCPLVALEFAGSGHHDSLGILALVAGLAVLEAGASTPLRRGLGLTALVAGGLVKLLPLALVPFALRRCRRPVLAAAAVALALVLACLPLLALRGGLAGLGAGASEYALRWESTSLVFRWIEPWFEDLGVRDGSWSDPRHLARAAVFGLWLAVLLHHWRRRTSLVRAGRGLVGTFIVLTPTLHPWYLAWIVPFVALQGSLAWSVLLALAPLLYWPLGRWQAEGVWQEPAWLWPALALPFLGCTVFELLRRRRARGDAA